MGRNSASEAEFNGLYPGVVSSPNLDGEVLHFVLMLKWNETLKNLGRGGKCSSHFVGI